MHYLAVGLVAPQMPGFLNALSGPLDGVLGTDTLSSFDIDLDLPRESFDAVEDRVMLCGSPSMLEELRAMLTERGFVEGSHNEPGHFVIEKAFAER